MKRLILLLFLLGCASEVHSSGIPFDMIVVTQPGKEKEVTVVGSGDA